MELLQAVSIFCVLFVNYCMSNHVLQEVQSPNGINNQDCLCFDKTALTFPDILGPSGKEWERVVVYFYKNPLTNEVQLHVPNHHKQYSFPDLSVDSNDLLIKVGKETVSEILSTNQYFIVLSNETPNWSVNTVSYDLTTDNVPLTVKPQTVTESVNVQGNVPLTTWHPNPINYVDYVPDITSVINVIDNIPATNWNIHSVTDGTTVVDAPVTGWNLNTIAGTPEVVDNVHPANWNSNTLKVTPSVVNNGPVTDWESWTHDKHQKPSVVDNGPVTDWESWMHDKHQKPSIVDNGPVTDWESWMHDKHQKPSIVDNGPVTDWESWMHDKHQKPSIVDNGPVTDWESWMHDKHQKPSIVDNGPVTDWESWMHDKHQKPSVDDNGPVTDWESGTHDKHQPGSVNIHGPTHWSNELISLLTKNEKNLPNVKNYDITAHIGLETFDDWFEHQIRMISHLSQSPLVDVPSLKVFIQKTLHDNHIYLSSAGFLIDVEGNILDLSNLKLRPILIGDSISYGNLPHTKDGKYILPTNLKYLEAILITLVYPPKVLGAIPIGKTYIPRSPYKNEYYYWNARTNQFGCGHGQCPHHSQKIEHDAKSSKSKSKKSSAVSSQVHSTYGHGNPFKHLETISNSLNLNPQIIDESLTHNGEYNIVLDELVNGLKSKNLQGINQFHVTTDHTASQETANVINLPPVYWEEIDYEEELPGFRIIGGNAATGSGTPVSSKGRSGFGPDP